MAIPSPQKRCGARRVRSRPSNDKLPDATGCSPATALMSVDLPAPLGPTTHTSSPDATSMETPRSAVAAPYLTSMWRTSSMRRPQEGGHDVGIREHRRRGALREDDAIIEHDQPIGQRQDGAHHV